MPASFVTFTFTIAKATQTISWSTPAAINYGTPLSGTQLNATVAGVSGGSDPGQLTYSPSAGTVLLSGNRTLWVTAAETVNYLEANGSVTLVVNPYTSNGYLQPISHNRAFKQGSTVPIKWQVKDASGNVLTNLSAISSLTVTGPSGTTTLYAGNLNSSGSSELKNSGGQYHYNWQTKGFDLGSYRITALLADGTSVTQTIMLSKTGAASGLVIDGVTGTAAVGILLAGDLTLYIDNSDGGFSSDELARIEAAIAGIELLVSPYGTNIYVVDSSVGLDANIILASGTTSVLGGLADGILGVSTSEGKITIIDGWNWYAGTDATAIGSGQYDFQTVITHEIGHSLGLGHSGNSVSVMFQELATADARRTLLFADLNTAGEEGGAGLHVEALFAAGHNQAATAQNSPQYNSPNKLKLAGTTGPAAPAMLLRSGIRELTNDRGLDVQIASDSNETDLNKGLRRPTKENAWRDAFKSGEADTLTDSQGIDSFFSGLAGDSGLLDIFTENAATELWNEMAF